MPRASKGGKVAGAPGEAYANRTDLNLGKSLPAQTVPGQGYGEAAAQQAAQRAIPLMAPSTPPPLAAPAQAPAGPMAMPEAAPPVTAPPVLKTIHDPGEGGLDEARMAMLHGTPMNQPNGVGGAASNDPEHLRLLQLVQNMADGPHSTTAMRELSEFMRLMIK